MRSKIIFLGTALLLFINCSSYKQLKPEPLLSPAEKGYIELKNRKKDFVIKQDEMYFVTFPAPGDDKYYLVVDIPHKKKYHSFLTASLVKNKKYGDLIKDAAADKDNISVYPIGRGISYFWLIDDIKEDVVLNMKYRYVPQWRFKFENKHAQFKSILENNCVKRDTYNNLGTSFHFSSFKYKEGLSEIKKKSVALDKVLKDLLAIRSLFPQSILNSQDEAYKNFQALKNNLEDEIEFQANYYAVLNFFKREYETRGNPGEFIKHVENFIPYFSSKENLSANVVKESQTVLAKRLDALMPFYDQRLSGKSDEKPFDQKLYLIKELNRVAILYEKAGITTPQLFLALLKYINDFDSRSKELFESKQKINEIQQNIPKYSKMPDNQFFPEIVNKTLQIKSAIPPKISSEHGKYQSYICSSKLNEAITKFTSEMETSYSNYNEAAGLVSQVNVFKAQRDFHGMLVILTQYRHLEFLLDLYKDLDKMSVEEQERNIQESLTSYRWREAEAALEQLYRDNSFINVTKIFPQKERAVRTLEDSIYITVDRVSRYRVDKFLIEKIDTLEDIDSLYNDSVFLPAYNVTFSTGSRRELIQRKDDLVAHLAKLKENQFPMKAVKILYERFVKSPNKIGVAMARAIVAHGKHYTGKDKRTKRRIAECNPWSSKWIVKPKQYRRVFALPITDNKNGTNRYFLRLNIRIPTDAKFPVYDVNIKLPKRIAKNAATKQWYEKITLNKKPLKNEGRFSIGAPSASNDYECQITPVRMDKDGNNYLDIYFKNKSFMVHSVSVMVQKPIIKKN